MICQEYYIAEGIHVFCQEYYVAGGIHMMCHIFVICCGESISCERGDGHQGTNRLLYVGSTYK